MMEHMIAAAPIVGRDAVLSEMTSTLGIGGPRAPGAVLLGGDAGIGKTRVVIEVSALAAAAGFRILSGTCVDLGDNLAAYAPIAEVFAELDQQERAQLTEDYPAISALLGDSDDDDGWLRADVFAAVGRSLEYLAAEQPVLLVLEDLHWADPSTRHLVQYLLAKRFTSPVSLMVTFRSDDLHRRHPLRPAVAEWTRLPSVQRIDLPPLDDDAMIALLRHHNVRIIDVAPIVERAAGNAFYAEELRDAGLSDGRLPADLADLLLVRFDRLSTAARTVARAVSCASGPVEDELLRRVLEPTIGHEIDAALREAVDLLVLTVSGDSVRFRHALLGEAVRDDMLPGERRAMHARFLQALPESAPVAAVALHAHGAGDLPAAFEANVLAAGAAERAGGYDEAATHYQRALQIVEHSPTTVDIADLVARTGEALVSCGRLRTAASVVQSHLEQANDPVGRARLLYARAKIDLVTRADEQVPSFIDLDRACDVPAELAAKFESLRAMVSCELGNDARAIEQAENALRLAIETGDEPTAAEAQGTLLRVAARRGPADDDIIFRCLNMIQSARHIGDTYGELRARHRLALTYLDRGDLQEAADEFTALVQASRQAGLERAPYGFDGQFFGALVAYIRGDWDAVLDYREGLARPTLFARACLGAISLLVQAGRGERPSPADLDAVRARWDTDQYPLALHSGAALIDMAPDVESAIAAHDELLVVMENLWRAPYAPYRLRTSGLLLGRLCAAVSSLPLSARARLTQIGARAAEDAELAATQATWLGPEAVAWLARCRAEYARLVWLTGGAADVDRLVSLWTESVDTFATYAERYEVARSSARLAQVLMGAGRSGDAAQHIATARDIALDLKAAPVLAELDAVSPSATDSALTPREREVLILMCDGRSNGEIAKRLFISTKTASVHVSNILAKLAASSRTEAAAIARREGLVPDTPTPAE